MVVVLVGYPPPLTVFLDGARIMVIDTEMASRSLRPGQKAALMKSATHAWENAAE